MTKYTVGITGGIASGKSSICKRFEHNGIPVFYADDQTRDLLTNDKELMSKVTELMGDRAYPSGTFDREWVSSQVFSRPEIRVKLDELLQSYIWREFLRWSDAQTSNVIALESAIIVEKGAKSSFDELVVVSADPAVRLRRAMDRNGASEEHVRLVMDAQMSDNEREQHADHIIRNDGSLEDVYPSVDSIAQTVKDNSQSKR